MTALLGGEQGRPGSEGWEKSIADGVGMWISGVLLAGFPSALERWGTHLSVSMLSAARQ
jgi:hypothetical protein